MIRINQENLSLLYGIALAGFMPLNVYLSSFSSVGLGDLLVFITFFLLSVYDVFHKKLRCETTLLLFIFYVVIQTTIQLNGEEIVLRAGRYVVYLLFVALFVVDFFDDEITLKLYTYISVFSTAIIILQYVIFKLFHYYLPGYLPFLKISREELVAYSEGIYFKDELSVRMRSIFQEPAHYASYVTGCLMLVLLRYKKNGEKKDIYLALYLSLGILIAASSTGIIIATFCWLIFIVYYLLERSTKKTLLSFLGLTAVMIPLALKMDTFKTAVLRLQAGYTIQERIGSNRVVIYELTEKVKEFLCGRGMILYGDYLPSWIRMFCYFGIVGVMMYVFPLFRTSMKSKEKILIFFYLTIMGIGSSLLLSGNSMLLIAFILQKNTENYNKENYDKFRTME